MNGTSIKVDRTRDVSMRIWLEVEKVSRNMAQKYRERFDIMKIAQRKGAGV